MSDDDPLLVSWHRRTPRLKAAFEVCYALGVMAFGAYIVATDPDPLVRSLGVALIVFFGLSLVFKVGMYAIHRGTNEVAKIEAETAAETHPDGCMCPFCMKHRVENDEDPNPHE